MRRYAWLVVVIVALGLLLYIMRRPPTAPAPAPGPTTSVDLVAQGGFVFVNTPADHKVEIGFMKPVSVTGCTVPVQTVTLMVDAGTIVDPANPPGDQTYTVNGGEVTLDDATASKRMSTPGLGKPSAPFHPPSTDTDADWQDLQWVADVSANGPSNKLAADWRSKVDGRFVLTNGVLNGGAPSDHVAKRGTWEFKSTNKPTAVAFKQAITDRVRFHVDLPGSDVVLRLTGAPSGTPSTIRIKPTSAGKVSLVLMGGHPSSAPAMIPVGARIEHFCAFYQLMDPVPAPGDWLYPYFAGLNTGTQVQANSGVSAANPGFYCPGDMF